MWGITQHEQNEAIDSAQETHADTPTPSPQRETAHWSVSRLGSVHIWKVFWTNIYLSYITRTGRKTLIGCVKSRRMQQNVQKKSLLNWTDGSFRQQGHSFLLPANRKEACNVMFVLWMHSTVQYSVNGLSPNPISPKSLTSKEREQSWSSFCWFWWLRNFVQRWFELEATPEKHIAGGIMLYSWVTGWSFQKEVLTP